MHQPWIDYSGLLVDNRYRLAELISEDGPVATFRTEDGLLVRCLDIKNPTAPRQLESWKRAVGLDHPNLLAVHAAGTLHSNGDEIAYAVMDRMDDSLASVVPERRLYPSEAQEVLEAILRALTFLHGRSLAHSKVNPAHIVAVGKNIQLTCDSLQPASERTTAEDVRAAGATLVEILTQHRNASLEELPPPYREIARGCAEKGWTSQQALAALEGRLPTAAALTGAKGGTVREDGAPEPAGNAFRLVPVLAAAVLLVMVAGGFFIWRGRTEPQVAAEVSPPPATRPTANQPEPKAETKAVPEPERPSPVRRAEESTRARLNTPPAKEPAPVPRTAPERVEAPVASDASSDWAVVTAIYRNYEAAEKRAETVREKTPGLQVTVFPERGQGQKYMVLVGSGLTQQDANRLRAEALSRGLPRDTYVTKIQR